jgi:renalase
VYYRWRILLLDKTIKSVAVVGAGVCGLAAAAKLASAGLDVHVFEKSRGIGGRLAVKRVEGHGSFDIGAQFMTAETQEFRDLLQQKAAMGLAAPWSSKMVFLSENGSLPAHSRPRWVGVPGMNAWVKDLFPREKITFGQTVSHLERRGGQWILDTESARPFDAVILAIPTTQALSLISPSISLHEPMREALVRDEMEPCWCVYVAFESRVELPYDAAFVRNAQSPFSWIARNSSKPGRNHSPDNWVLHASSSWTRVHFDRPAAEVEQLLLRAFGSLYQAVLPPTLHVGSHRWRYASPKLFESRGSSWDPSMALGFAGDWAHGGRVEGAYLAGIHLAQTILNERKILV